MKTFLTAALLWSSLFTLSACMAKRDNASVVASANDSQNWHAAIQCDGAVVDVDLNERRDFQLVVKNPALFPQFDQWPFRQLKNDHERIYRGQAIRGQGVFQSESFYGFFANSDTTDATGNAPGYVIRIIPGSSPSIRFAALNLEPCFGELRDNELDKVCPIIGQATIGSCNFVPLP